MRSMSFFSCAWVSGMTITALKPSALATMAMPMPVLPAVPSTIAPPGRNAPLATASLMIARAARSLTDPPGFMNSALPRIVHPVASEAARRWMRGVRPIAATTSRTGFIALLSGSRAKVGDGACCDKPRPLPQGFGGRGADVFHRLEDLLDARLADQPSVVRRAHRRRAFRFPARPLRARARARRDPRAHRRGDAPFERAPDRAIGESLPRPARRHGPADRNHRARRGDRRRDQR